MGLSYNRSMKQRHCFHVGAIPTGSTNPAVGEFGVPAVLSTQRPRVQVSSVGEIEENTCTLVYLARLRFWVTKFSITLKIGSTRSFLRYLILEISMVTSSIPFWAHRRTFCLSLSLMRSNLSVP